MTPLSRVVNIEGHWLTSKPLSNKKHVFNSDGQHEHLEICFGQVGTVELSDEEVAGFREVRGIPSHMHFLLQDFKVFKLTAFSMLSELVHIA